jgi:hypothetical protein
MNITEKIVDKASIDELTRMSSNVLSHIELPVGDSLLDSIDKAVYSWQQSESPPKGGELDADDFIFAFGTAWGNTVVQQHGWQWVDLTFHEHDDWVGRAVVSPDRSLYILSYAHIHECLGGTDEVKISMSINVIGSELIPALEPHSYVNLIHNVQRIVPRL